MAAILVLVAVTVVVVGVAFVRHHRHHLTSPLTTPTSSLGNTGAAGAHQSAATAVAASRTPAPLVALSPSGTALFAEAGCQNTPALLGSATAGVKWIQLPSPATHLLRLQLFGTHTGFAVGTDASCTPRRYNATNAQWGKALPVGATWFPFAKGVHDPNGATATPCGTASPEPVSFASDGNRDAIVICPVGVFETTTGGASWSPTGELPGGQPVSVALTTRGRGLLLLYGNPSCAGLRVARTHDGGVTAWHAGACLTGMSAPAGVALAPNGAGIATTGPNGGFYTRNAGRKWHGA